MIKTNYISCACNQLPHTVDWGRNNLICYASNHAIVIYNPHIKKFGAVLSTLHVHSDRINVVRWIKPNFPKLETEFISASSDGTAIIWNTNNLTSGVFKATDILRINEPTNICDAIYLSSNSSNLLICTGSINGDFRLWLRIGKQKIEPTQIINFSKKVPIEAKLALLSSKFETFVNPLLLLAMEDSTVLLYSTTLNINNYNQKKIEDFVKVQTLIGHKDWVTSIDYMLTDSQILFVATGSQDNTIRLWKITHITTNNSKSIKSEELKPKQQNFFIRDQEYEIILESILDGHDAWIYEVHWHPPIEINGIYSQPMKLLSCSLDKTAIVWEPNINTQIWSEIVRVGEVGGNSLGFYGCKFSPDGRNFLTHGYHGTFHIWKYQEDLKNWISRTAPTGHCSNVMDLCWDPKGRFLITASADQTTRIHAPWSQKNGEESWYEIGRPQIHGYNMTSLAILTPYMFASGGEEKVIRIFTAPLTFKNYLEKTTDDISDFDNNAMVERASVPTLGLTNKAILDKNLYFLDLHDNISKTHYRDINYKEPPLEEILVQSTLWPELQKLYGHGYEIFSMAARNDGALLATASKSTTPEHAVIILWDTKTWCQTQQLFSHQLTVTQLAFSPNDIYLLSVSRDRQWSLFRCHNVRYELLINSSKYDSFHTRIIWCCAWTNDSKYFATGSRDGKIGIWSNIVNMDIQSSPITKFCTKNNSVTALAFAPLSISNKFIYILAAGYENGCIDIRKIQQTVNKLYEWIQIAFLNSSEAHHLTVKRLAFRPKYKTQEKNVIQLASCGSDSLVKIYDIILKLNLLDDIKNISIF